MSLDSILFFCNRYLTLIGEIPGALESFSYFSEEGCHQLRVYDQCFLMVSQGIIVVLLGIRVFALYERSKKVLVLLVTVYAIMIAVAGWAVVTSQISRDGAELGTILLPACDLTLTLQQSYRFAGAWGTELFCDLVIFVLTLCRLACIVRVWTGTLSEVMLRDGVLYFGALVILHTSNIAAFIFGPPAAKGMLTTLTNAISSTLVTRMVLNIWAANHKMALSSSSSMNSGPAAAYPALREQ